MKRHGILTRAKQVDWDLPADEKREAGHAVRMLMNGTNDRERRVLERMTRKMSDLEMVGMLREMADP